MGRDGDADTRYLTQHTNTNKNYGRGGDDADTRYCPQLSTHVTSVGSRESSSKVNNIADDTKIVNQLNFHSKVQQICSSFFNGDISFYQNRLFRSFVQIFPHLKCRHVHPMWERHEGQSQEVLGSKKRSPGSKRKEKEVQGVSNKKLGPVQEWIIITRTTA